MEQLKKLLELQEIDIKLTALNKIGEDKERIRNIKKKEEDINKLKEELTELDQQYKKHTREIKSCEARSDSMGEKRSQYREKMYSGDETNSKELIKLEEKIADVTKMADALEDTWTQLTEKADDLKENIKGKRSRLKALIEEFNEEVTQYKKDKGEHGESRKELKDKRDNLENQIDNKLITRYNHRHAQNRSTVSVLRDGNCTGCGMEVSSELMEKVKREIGFQKCDYCDRFLVESKS